jgi:hypothetical protein
VPVRQIRVAELGDDVAVRFSEATRRKRNMIRDRNLVRDFEAKIMRARTQLRVATRRNLVREKFFEPAKSEMHTFSRVTVAKPATPKKARKLERTSREPDFGSQRIRFFHGNENKTISTLLSSKRAPRECFMQSAKSSLQRDTCSAEAGDETGEAKGTRRRERTLLDLQKPVTPAEAIEGVVKRIDLLGSVPDRKI